MAFIRKRGKYYHLIDKRLKKEYSLKESNRSAAQNIVNQYNAQQTLDLLPIELKTKRDSITLSESLELYFNRPRKRQRLRPISKATIVSYTLAISSFTKICGDKPVQHYGPADFNLYLRAMQKPRGENKYYSTNTIASYTRQQYIIFNFLKKQHYIKDNPITVIEESTDQEVEIIPEKILEAMLQNLLERKLVVQHNLVKLTYLFGLRSTEACNVHIEDINLKRKTFAVRNSKGNRVDTIPILKDSISFLRSLKLTGTGPMFHYKDRNSLKKFWGTVNAKCKVHYQFHSLRRARASMLANSGVEPLFLQEFMRHKDLRTTKKYYVNIDRDKMRNSMNNKL